MGLSAARLFGLLFHPFAVLFVLGANPLGALG